MEQFINIYGEYGDTIQFTTDICDPVSGVNGEVTIAVVDMNGRTVSSETVNCAADCVKKVNVSNLTQGAYFVRIYGENVNSVKKLIVK